MASSGGVTGLFEIPRKFRRERRQEHRGPRLRFKGSSGTNTVTQQSGPPPQVLANYQQVYNQAQNVAAQPYQPYTGSTVAGFTPMQQAAFNNIDTAANAAQPYQDAAGQYVTNAATTIDPSNFGGTVSQYESPYTAQVVNATEAEQANQNAQQQQQVAGNAVSAGAWGGDRSAVAQGITAGQQALAEAPVIANLENTGFQNATSAAESNAYLNSSAGAEMGALGQTEQAEGLQGANAQLQAGGLQQQLAQSELNVPYQAYQAAQAYPFQTTNWLEGMATGTGAASGTQGSTTSPGPSTASQIAGLGLTGLAGYNLYNNAGTASSATNYVPSTSSAAYDTYLNTGAARGGRVPHRAVGGNIGGLIPMGGNGVVMNIDATGVPPQVSVGGSNGLLGGGGNLLTSPTGTTSTTSGGGPSEFAQLLGDAGEIAAGIYGGPVAGMAAGAFNQAVGLRTGGHVGGFAPGDAPRMGGIEDHARVTGLRPVPVRPRGFDTGGGVTPGLTASVGGNPMLVQAAQTYDSLPTDQLHQLAARYSPQTPQGQLVQRALSMRNLYPQSNPAQPSVPTGAPQSSSAAQSQPGLGPLGQSPGMSPMFARGGAPEDDTDLADLTNTTNGMLGTQAGPSVPGGLSAGLTAMQPSPQQMLSQHAMAMNRAGSYTPPPPDLAPVVLAAANKYGVDPKPLAWMLSQESHWNPAAYNPQSGTAGLGQFKTATAKEMGINPLDPAQAIDGAAHYLRQKLDETGDYESAIGRYGTFSTGHGKDADNAVRGQYRAFMQGSSRGGAIGGFAPGGEVDDSGDSDPMPAPPIPPDGMLDTAGNVTDAWASSYPASSDAPPPPIGGVQPVKADPWEAALTAGLGMMAGTSPHPLVNIGQGGLAGIKDYQQQKQLSIQDQMRIDQAKTNAAWRAGQLALQGKKADLYGNLVDSKTGLIDAQTAAVPLTAQARVTAADAAAKRADAAGLVGQARADYIRTQTALAPQIADAATTRAGAAADTAAATVPLRQAQTAAVPVNTQTRATAAATAQARLALSQQAALALDKQRGIANARNASNDSLRQVNAMTDEQLRAIVAGKDPNGIKPAPTPTQAGQTVRTLRGQAQSAMPAAPAAPVIPGAPPPAVTAPPPVASFFQ